MPGGATPPPAPSGFTDPGEKERGLGRPSNLGTAGEARAPKALAAAAGGHSAVPWGHPSIPRDPSPRSPRPHAAPARPAPAGPGMLPLPEPFWRRVPQPCARLRLFTTGMPRASSSWGMCGGACAPPPIPCLPLEE